MLNVCRLIKTSEGNKNPGPCTHRCSKRLSNYLNERTLLFPQSQFTSGGSLMVDNVIDAIPSSVTC